MFQFLCQSARSSNELLDANGSNGAFCILDTVPTPNPDSGIIKSNDQLFLGGKNTNIEQINLIVMAILTQQIGALQNGV